MALRTVSNTGGNWNVVGAWVGGVVPIAGDTVAFTATSGPLVVNVSTAILAGINFTNYVNTITFNQPINTNGTINLNTGGYTQAGASGLIISGTATISGSATWSRILTFTGTTYTITLGSTINVTGQVTFSQTGTLSFSVGVNTFNPTGNILVAHGITTLPNNLNIINLSIIPSTTTQPTLNTNTINISGNLTLNSNTGGMFVGGTTSLILTGTGTWSHSGTAMQLRNNLTINTTGILTVSGNVYYNTGTLTYIPNTGSVVTTGSTLNVNLNTTLNTNTLNWNNVVFFPAVSSTITITLTSNFNVLGTLSHVQNTGFIIINGLFNINVSGNLSTGAIVSGTSTHVLNGTGTISTGNFFRTSLTINTAGTITISGAFYFSTGTLTHVTGNVIFSNTILWITLSATLNTSNLTWPTVYINSGTATLTLLSNLVTDNFTANQGVITWVTGGNSLIVNNDMIVGSDQYPSGGGTTTLTIPNELNVRNLTLNTTAFNSSSGIYPTTVNGSAIYVTGNLRVGNYSYLTNPITGTSNIILIGTGTFSSSFNGFVYATLSNNLIINTGGTITFSGSILYSTGTLTYLSGKVITKNSILYLQSATTLINCHRINFDRVVIASGVTITMNEFFSGSPGLKTTMSPSTTTNYTIAFRDGFEKISKFVNISGCTLAKPQQLLVITNSKRSSTNTRGIRYINQSPNGIPKGKPSISSPMTFGAGGLLSDPNMR